MTLAATDTVAALDVDPQISLAEKRVGQAYAMGSFVFARLAAAPEIEIFKGRYYVDGVELAVRPSRCGPPAPSRRGGGET
jgi:hypothetical protein